MGNERFDKLTDRQKQCLRLVRTGFTTKEIAGQVGASPDAIDKAIKLAMARIGADRRQLAARMLAEYEAECGVQPLAPQSSDLSTAGSSGEMSRSPSLVTTPPTVAEDRAFFIPDLGPAHQLPHSEKRGAKEGGDLGGTVNRVLERVVQIAGVLLMVLALAGLLSVAYHRWEQAHHIRPR